MVLAARHICDKTRPCRGPGVNPQASYSASSHFELPRVTYTGIFLQVSGYGTALCALALNDPGVLD
jgi:hypothetical protein